MDNVSSTNEPRWTQTCALEHEQTRSDIRRQFASSSTSKDSCLIAFVKSAGRISADWRSLFNLEESVVVDHFEHRRIVLYHHFCLFTRVPVPSLFASIRRGLSARSFTTFVDACSWSFADVRKISTSRERNEFYVIRRYSAMLIENLEYLYSNCWVQLLREICTKKRGGLVKTPKNQNLLLGNKEKHEKLFLNGR